MKYSIIGDEDTVLGFGMVIITERIADMIRSTVDKYLFTVSFPLIVEIPDRNGTKPGRPGIKEMVNTAIGLKL